MKTTIKTTVSALMLASVIVGGASSAFAGGDYYDGASSTPDSRVYTQQRPVEGRSQDNRIDPAHTGSIWRRSTQAQQPVVNGGEGDYYQGAVRR